MCGRFYVEPDTDDSELRAIIDEVNRKAAGGAAIGEVFPGNTVAAVANSRAGTPRPFPMHWGYARGGGNLIINARSETAQEKPMFCDSMRRRRCLIPATCYFEWQRRDGGKTKYSIRPQNGGVVYLAGLYRPDGDAGTVSCVILTRPASDSVIAVHNRMPVILPREALTEWLSPDVRADALLGRALEMMHAEPAAV